jgi:hypothetical protein
LYYPKTTAKPLEFGVAFHKAMEVLYDPMLWSRPEEAVLNLAIVTFNKECNKQYDKFLEVVQNPDDEQRQDYLDRKKLGAKMLEQCVRDGRRKDHDEGFRPILVEVAFEIPIIDPVQCTCEYPYEGTPGFGHHPNCEKGDTDPVLWCKCDNCWDRYVRHVQPEGYTSGKELNNWNDDYYRHWNGLPVTYGGRIDCIMEGPDGRVWVVDWKTASRLTDREEFLLLDDQVARYCYAMRFLRYRVAGFLYHELLKAANEEPEPMQRRRLGRLFSTNKQIAVSADVYERTVKELDPEAYNDHLYDEFIEYLKEVDNQFSFRHTVYKTDIELNEVGKNIFLEAREMVDPTLSIYPNPGRFNCQNCAFLQPCLESNSGGDVEFTLDTLFDKREYHYWEKEPMSTDRKQNV